VNRTGGGLPQPPILVITDRRRCPEPLESRVLALLHGGCRWLSVREKDLDPHDRLALLERLAPEAAKWGAVLGVHDDVAAAARRGLALHLPRGGNPAGVRRALAQGALLGQSCHDAAEVAQAFAAGVDYVTLSPVFASATKPGYRGLPLDGFSAVAAQAPGPVLALGGVGLDTAPRLLGTGFSGLATMGGPMTAENPEAWFSELAKAWRRPDG
jgi:thiamine-phosphate pyrophosphorylase